MSGKEPRVQKVRVKPTSFGRLRDRRGAAAVLLMVSTLALLAVVAGVINVTRLFAVKAELQTAVDAAALAGAVELALGGGDDARDSAIVYAARNLAEAGPVVVPPENVTFGVWDPWNSTFTPLPSALGADAVDVWASKNISGWLESVLGLFGIGAAARATAWAGAPVGETRCVKPWAIPEEYLEVIYDNNVEEWEVEQQIGEQFTLKSAIGGPADELNESGIPSFFYPVVLPPYWDYTTGQYTEGTGERGANWYRDNIANCFAEPVGVGDSLLTEPGNMPGPTVQGARALCTQVVNTYCYDADGSLGVPMIAAFWNSDVDPIGRTTVEISRLGSFRLEQVYNQGQHGVIVGRFVGKITTGGIGPGATTLSTMILVR